MPSGRNDPNAPLPPILCVGTRPVPEDAAVHGIEAARTPLLKAESVRPMAMRPEAGTD